MIKPIFVSVLILLGILGCDLSTESKVDPLVLDLDPTRVSAYGGSDGAIDLTVTGGTAPYEYAWSTGDTTEDIDHLSAGTYSVVVQDVAGQVSTDSAIVNQPPNPLLGRTYHTHVPESYTGARAVPLVIALHYYGKNGSYFEEYTGFSDVADTAGFIVVYPDATGSPSEWNEGLGITPSTLAVDDVAFISALIDRFKSNYNIDANRVYLTGFSSGSVMAHKLAGALASKIAAIGAVSGQATTAIMNGLHPSRPVGVIHIHMLDDNSLEYDGGVVNGVPYPAVETVMEKWVALNNCGTTPANFSVGEAVSGRRWTAVGSNADVVLITVATGGHSWPTDLVSATDRIWEFFREHPR
ncbi:PHB depolymerase family esterase [Candidatus Neomarinimicrobiota bacterium]